MNRLMIAATGSGCGKTTVSCALLAAFKNMGKTVASFKCGPDYIDTSFHRKALLTNSYNTNSYNTNYSETNSFMTNSFNLDTFLMGEDNVRYCIWRHGRTADICLIEGVMGLYDGVGYKSLDSSNLLSIVTGTPTVLLVNAGGKFQSVCAEIYGFLRYKKNNIRAVILNNTSEAVYRNMKNMIERELSVKVAGFMPGLPETKWPSRHLGLVTAGEIADIQKKIDILAEHAVKHIDIEGLFELSKQAVPITVKDDFLQKGEPVYNAKIYVANDEAFCFYYQDNLEFLASLGADLRFFSPIHDRELPKDADGIILWGGYPELHAKKLAENISMKNSIVARLAEGMPVYAEGGGFVYLHQYLMDLQGAKFPMLGFLKGSVKMTDNLQTFGYAILTANHDNMLCDKNEKINCHVFRFSVSDNEGDAFTATKTNGSSYPCIVAEGNLFAGYPHIHFWGNKGFAERFVRTCHYR